MRTFFLWLAIFGLVLPVESADSPVVETVPTLDQLLVRIPKFGEVLLVSGRHTTNDWGVSREVRHIPDSTLFTNQGNVFAVSNQPTAQWVFPDRSSQVQDARWWGIVNSTNVSSADALQAALNYAAMTSATDRSLAVLIPKGEYRIDKTVVIKGNLEARTAVFHVFVPAGWPGTNYVAFQVGDPTLDVRYAKINLPSVEFHGNSHYDGSAAFEFREVNYSELTLARTFGSQYGIRVNPTVLGFAYDHVRMGQHREHKVTLALLPQTTGSGFVNDNLWDEGSYFTPRTSPYVTNNMAQAPGYAAILTRYGGTGGDVNNNVWVKPVIEGSAYEHLVNIEGRNNIVWYPRNERQPDATTIPKVAFYFDPARNPATTLPTHYNKIEMGFMSPEDQLGIERLGNTNYVVDNWVNYQGQQFTYGANGSPMVRLVQQNPGAPALAFYPHNVNPGTNAALWTTAWAEHFLRFKAASDVNARFFIQATNGLLGWSDGTAGSDLFMQKSGSDLLLSSTAGGVRVAGATGLRIDTGGKFWTPAASRPVPSHVASWGSDPVNGSPALEATSIPDLANLLSTNGGGGGGSSASVTVANIAALKNLIPSPASSNVFVLGYFNAGDWGEPRLFTASTTITTPNLGNVFQNINQPSVYYVAWDRKSEEQDCRWWGAIPDDALYDGLNLQAAISGGYRVLTLPAGTFNLRDGETVYGGLWITNTMTLRGTHRESTILSYTGTTNTLTIGPTNWTAGGSIPVIQGVEVRDIFFYGNWNTNSSVQNHIKIRGASHGVIEDCKFSNAPVGDAIRMEEGAWIWDINRCSIGFANVGIRMLATGPVGSIISATHITGGEIAACQWGILTGTTNAAPDIYAGTRLHANIWITDTTIEGNGTNYVSGGKPGGGIWLNAAESVNIDGIYTEGNPVDLRLGSLSATNALSCKSINVNQVRFADSMNGVQFYSATGVILDNNYWIGSTGTNIVVFTTNVVKCEVRSGNISNSQISDCPTINDPLGLLLFECGGGGSGLVVNSIADLVAVPPFSGNSNVMVLGYYSSGDWGNPRKFYQISSFPGNSATNRGHRFASSSGSIHWMSRDAKSSSQYAVWFGVPTDGVTSAVDGLQACYYYCTNQLQVVGGYGSQPSMEIPIGFMLVDRPLDFGSPLSSTTTPLTANAAARISGHGPYQSQFRVSFTNATDANYPALDFTGHENGQFDHFSVVIPYNATYKPKTALLLARKAEGQVSGVNQFLKVHVVGRVGLTQLAIVSSEVNRFEDCRFQQYDEGDQYSMLVIGYFLDTPENPGVKRVDSKFYPLANSMASGNGINYFNLCWFHANPSDQFGHGGSGTNNLPRARLEFTQHAVFDSCFWATPTNGSPAVEIDFRTEGPIFRGNRQEHSAGPAAASQFVRILSQSNGSTGQGPVNGLSIQNCAVGGIYATNGSQIFGMELTGLRPYAHSAVTTSEVYPVLDVWDLFNSRIAVPRTSTNYSEPYLLSFAVRGESGDNAWMVPTNAIVTIASGAENDYDISSKHFNAGRYKGIELGGLEFLDAATINATHAAASLNSLYQPRGGPFTLQMLVTLPIQTIDGSTHGLVSLASQTNGTLFSGNGFGMTVVQSDLRFNAYGASISDVNQMAVQNFVPNYMGRRVAVTMVRDAGTNAVRVYLDGYKQKLVNTILGAGASWAQDFTGATKINIGGLQESAVANCFRGIVHRATLWTNSLTEGQVLQEAKYGIRPNQGALPAPVLDLSFVGHPGQTNVADLSGNNQRADIYGNPAWRTHYAAAGYVGSGGGGGGFGDVGMDNILYGRSNQVWQALNPVFGQLKAPNTWAAENTVDAGFHASGNLNASNVVTRSLTLVPGALTNTVPIADAATSIFSYQNANNTPMSWQIQNANAGNAATVAINLAASGATGSIGAFPTTYSSATYQGRTRMANNANGMIFSLTGANPDAKFEFNTGNSLVITSNKITEGLVIIDASGFIGVNYPITAGTPVAASINTAGPGYILMRNTSTDPASASGLYVQSSTIDGALFAYPMNASVPGYAGRILIRPFTSSGNGLALYTPYAAQTIDMGVGVSIPQVSLSSSEFIVSNTVHRIAGTSGTLLQLERPGFTNFQSLSAGVYTVTTPGGILALQNSIGNAVAKNLRLQTAPYLTAGRPVSSLLYSGGAGSSIVTIGSPNGGSYDAVSQLDVFLGPAGNNASAPILSVTPTSVDILTNSLQMLAPTGLLSHVSGFDLDPTGTAIRRVKTMTMANLANLLTPLLPPGGGGGITDAPSDSKYYGRRNALWTDLGLVYQPLDQELSELAAITPNNGDLLMYNSQWSRRTVGPDGYVLTSTNGFPTWLPLPAGTGGGDGGTTYSKMMQVVGRLEFRITAAASVYDIGSIVFDGVVTSAAAQAGTGNTTSLKVNVGFSDIGTNYVVLMNIDTSGSSYHMVGGEGDPFTSGFHTPTSTRLWFRDTDNNGAGAGTYVRAWIVKYTDVISGGGGGSMTVDGANAVTNLADSSSILMTATAGSASASIVGSVALTGDPTAPTPAYADKDSSIATTRFVMDAEGSSSGYRLWDDLLSQASANSGDKGTVTIVSGGTAAISVAEAAHPGMRRLRTTAAGNYATLGWVGPGAPSMMLAPSTGLGEQAYYESMIKTPAVLSGSGASGVDQYAIRLGFFSGANATNVPSDGAYLVHQTNMISAQNWILQCANNSVNASPVDTGIPVVINTWVKLGVLLTATNAVAYINGTPVVTNTSQIPQGRAVNAGVQQPRFAGTATVDVQIDWCAIDWKGNR